VNDQAHVDDAGMVAILAALGAQLRRIRLERGWQLKDLAAELGVSMSVLCRLELARREPSARNLILICGALEVRLSDVLRRAEDEAFPLGLAPWSDLERRSAVHLVSSP
jgi:transcriptional regulator with XRE-family HTH domain